MHKEFREIQECKVKQDLPEHKVFRVILVLKEIPEHKVFREILVFKAQSVKLVLRVHKESRE